MLLSIIVPAYNVEKYIAKCIESLVTQKNIKYEIIIVDDGATDLTGKISDKLSEKYKEIVRVIHQDNKGLGGARNSGILNANGKYIAFVDSDDFLVDNAFGRMFEAANYQDFDMLCFEHMELREGDSFTKDRLLGNKQINSYIQNKVESLKDFFNNRISSYSWDKIYKKSIFSESKILFTEKTYFEDLRVSYELISKCETIIRTDFCAYVYLQRANSITKSLTAKHYNDYIKEYSMILDNITDDIKFELKEDLIVFNILKYNSAVRILSNIEDKNNILNKIIRPNVDINRLLKLRIPFSEKLTYILGEKEYIYTFVKKIARLAK